jgi:hypothetical protein
MTVDDGSLDDIEAFIESSFYNAVLNSPMTAKEESDSELGEVHAIDVSFDAPTEGVPGRQGNGNDKESTPVIFPPPPGNGKGEKSKAVVPSSRSGNGDDKKAQPVIFPPPPGNGKGEKSKAVVPSSRSGNGDDKKAQPVIFPPPPGNGDDKKAQPVIFPPPPGNGKGEKSKAVVPSSRSDRAGPEKRDNRGSKNQEGGYFGKDRMTLLLQIYSLQTELRKVKTGEVASGAGSPGS